jgi:magnesium chelatase family protein
MHQDHSTSGLLPANADLVATRPFRSPHHSVSDGRLIGADSTLRPSGADTADLAEAPCE